MNMEHFIRIAFWITLSGFLQTESLPISDFGINFLQGKVKCLTDSSFYAPTNVEKQCITTALDCVMKELNGTAKVECEDPFGYIDDAVEFLDHQIKERLGKGHALTNSTECAGERWPQTPFSDFLEKVFSLLQLEKNDALLS